eukprot:11734_1
MYYIVSLCILLLVITGTAELIDCRTKRCLYETVMCDDDRPCIVDCAYDDGDYFGSQEACESSLIHCPVNGTCEVRCDGPEACQDARIDATHSAQLNITCNGHFESCYGVKIFCPHAGNCIITAKNTVEHPDAFVSVDIFAANALDNMNLSMSLPQQSNVTIYCGSGDQYTQCQEHQQCNESASPCAELLSSQLNATILPSTVGSTFDCYSDECRYLTLICTENTQCNITCTDSQSCTLTAIHCAANESCVVTCDADAACAYMQIYAGDASELRLTCYDHTESCHALEVFCPKSAQSCMITSYNDNLFWVYAKNGIHVVAFNQLSPLKSKVEFWCGYRIEYRCNLDNVFHCDASNSCLYSGLECERNKTCEVICDAAEACKNAYIDARHAKELTVTCADYVDSCGVVFIFCADGAERCTIIVDNNNQNVLDGMEMFTFNGENDIVFSAEKPLQSHVFGHCVITPQADECIITPLKHCFSSCFQFYRGQSTSPTVKPSYLPSMSPTKSINPTVNPTLVPSTIPTTVPTQVPTEFTNKPTVNPTNMMTFHPTVSITTSVPAAVRSTTTSTDPTSLLAVPIASNRGDSTTSSLIINPDTTSADSIDVLLLTVLVGVTSLITTVLILYLARKCYLHRKKSMMVMGTEDSVVIDEDHNQANIVIDPIAMGNKDHVEMAYTVEGPQYDDKRINYDNYKNDAGIGDVDGDKIWNNKVEMINKLYCTNNQPLKPVVGNKAGEGRQVNQKGTDVVIKNDEFEVIGEDDGEGSTVGK